MVSGPQQQMTRKRQIRRALWFAIAWLAIGATVNVGVAWALTLVPRLRNHIDPVTEIGEFTAGRWLAWMPEDCRAAEPSALRETFFGATHVHQKERPGAFDAFFITRGGYRLGTFQFGIPFRSMLIVGGRAQMSDFSIVATHRPGALGVLEVGIPIGAGDYLNEPNLPLMPLWRGFLLNTLIYAIVAFGVWRLFGALRRARRQRRGMCVVCGYALAGLAPNSACPECGGMTTPASHASS